MTDRQKYRELYWCWKAIKQRCLNPRCRAYRNYGGRGIAVCDEWLSFEPFLAWALGAGWQKGLDLDRIDNDGDYAPDNCRFVTRRENVNNRRKTRLITVDGVTHPSTVWADLIGAKEALNSVIDCLDDPLAGMRTLEENIGKLRFRMQVMQMEREG